MSWWERTTPVGRAVLVVAGVVVVAAVAVPLLVTRGRGSPPAPPAEPTCGTGGCATVSSVQQLGQVTVLTGASCQGPRGSWFFHAIEQGAPTQLRPNYSLRFNFSATAATAAPNGEISIPPTTDTTVTLTLNEGALRLTGTHAGKPVDASGTLSVALTGTAAAPSLTFSESGLTPSPAGRLPAGERRAPDAKGLAYGARTSTKPAAVKSPSKASASRIRRRRMTPKLVASTNE